MSKSLGTSFEDFKLKLFVVIIFSKYFSKQLQFGKFWAKFRLREKTSSRHQKMLPWKLLLTL